jgi:lipopolysaccharide transport system permease protein
VRFSRNTKDGNPATRDKWVINATDRISATARVREVWQYRRILWFFARDAFEKLYAKTHLGWLWILIRPLAPVVLGSLVFGGVMGVPSDGMPYFLFFLTGSIAWGFFEGPLGWGNRGLELNRHLITKVYFPRMILPLATMTPGLVEPVINLGILAIATVYYFHADGRWYVVIGPRLLMDVVVIILTLVFAFGLSLWLSVWQVRARDVRFLIGYILGFWSYFTPIIYPVSAIPARWRWVAELNPMTGLVETFKWATLGTNELHLLPLASSGVLAIATLASGVWYFTFMESRTADRA